MRTLFFLLLSCVACCGQFGVEQPIFAVPTGGTNHPSPVLLMSWQASVGVTNTSDVLASDGERVKVWATNAIGGQNYPLYQLGNDNYRPVYHSSGGPNNQAYLEFPLGNEHLYTRLTNKFTQNYSFPLLVVGVLRLTRTDAGRGYIMDGNTARTSLVQLETETKFSISAPAGGLVSEAVLENTWYLVSAYYKTNQNYFRTNGVACGSVGGNDIGTGGLTGISIGGSYFDGYQFDGDMAEFRVYGSTGTYILSNDVRTIEYNMGTTYGITIP